MKREPLRKRIVVIAAMALGLAALAFLPVAFAGDSDHGGDKYGYGGYGGYNDNHGDRDGDYHWVGTWSTAPQTPSTTSASTKDLTFSDQTLRQIVHTSIGGDKVRVRLTNALGNDNLVIGAAHIALRAPCTVIPGPYTYPTATPPTGTCTELAGSAIIPSSDRTLFFGGAPSIIIPPGGMALSDPVKLNVPKLSDLAVSIYLPGTSGPPSDPTTSPITRHGGAFQTNYVSPAGDYTGDASMPDGTTIVQSWYFLFGVDVKAPKEIGAIVTLGDSITDGTRSTPDTNSRWPNQLARRLLARHSKEPMGVLDVGISGNRILSGLSTNPVAASRLERDVLTQPGVEYVIVLEGINDSSTTVLQPDKIIQGLSQIIERAHERGLTIYGATLTPAGQPGAPDPPNIREQNRQTVNAWIRTSGKFDAVIDFDEVTRDPSNPTFFLPEYDSGDHLHPNDVGYQAMGNAIDLRLFKEDNDHH
jgi:lysophospholipase L1-like esterase